MLTDCAIYMLYLHVEFCTRPLVVPELPALLLPCSLPFQNSLGLMFSLALTTGICRCHVLFN